MPQALLIAAGGGGDVIAAAAIARALGLEPGETLIASLAWERLLIDPEPGPRSPADFTGLSVLGQQNFEILQRTEPKAPGTSTLPRLRAELGHRLVLLDPRRGATGLAEQLGDLLSLLTGEAAAYLLDVGGDILANGSEPGLKSPLADTLMLAATAHLGSAVELLVAGPGLDGELNQSDVHNRFEMLGAHHVLTLDRTTTASALSVLEWHPSEATALLIAGAMGVSGVVEIRDAGTQIPLSSQSAQVWGMHAAKAATSPLANAVFETTSFDDAERALQRLIGWTELEYERRKAHQETSTSHRSTITDAVLEDAKQFEADARQRGTDLVTFRRIAQAIGVPRAHVELRGRLLTESPHRHRPPLWAVTSETSA